MNDINHVFNNPDQDIIENMARNYTKSNVDNINKNIKFNYFSPQGNFIKKQNPEVSDNLDSFINSESDDHECNKIMPHIHNCKKCKHLLELFLDTKKKKEKI